MTTDNESMTGWVNSRMECWICRHRWIATHHTDTESLECPKCSARTRAASGERLVEPADATLLRQIADACEAAGNQYEAVREQTNADREFSTAARLRALAEVMKADKITNAMILRARDIIHEGTGADPDLCMYAAHRVLSIGAEKR